MGNDVPCTHTHVPVILEDRCCHERKSDDEKNVSNIGSACYADDG